MWWKGLYPQAKIAFFSTFLWGFIAHGILLLNKISIHDDAHPGGLFGVGGTYRSGRWMLGIISELEQTLFDSTHFNMPLFNGLISILLFAVSIALLISLFRIKSYGVCLAVSGVLVTFPGIAALFGYIFTAPYYLFAFFLAVLSAFLLCRYRSWGWFAAAVSLFTCATGIYQAYIPVILSILVTYFIVDIIEHPEKDSLAFLRTALYYVAACIAGIVAYFLLNKFFLRLFHVKMYDYIGLDQMGRESLSTYLSRILPAYETFFFPWESYSTGRYYVVMGLRWPYIFVVSGIVIFLAVSVVRTWKSNRWNALLLAVASVVFPLAANFIHVMGPEVHGLMICGQGFLFVLSACLVDRLCLDKKCIIRWVCILCAVVMLLFPVVYCRYDNALSLHMTYAQERTINYFNTLVTRIKSTEGYRDDLPVAYINMHQITDKTLTPLDNFYYILPFEDAPILVNNYSSQYFVNTWLGFWPKEVEDFSHPDIEAMPCYPDDGSIKIIDDVIVVKFQ